MVYNYIGIHKVAYPRSLSYNILLQAYYSCQHILYCVFFTDDTSPFTKDRHHRIWTFSLVPRAFTQRSARDSKAKKKYIYFSTNDKKLLSAILTGEQRPSTSFTHTGSAVRPELRSPAAPSESSPLVHCLLSSPPSTSTPPTNPNSVLQSGG